MGSSVSLFQLRRVRHRCEKNNRGHQVSHLDRPPSRSTNWGPRLKFRIDTRKTCGTTTEFLTILSPTGENRCEDGKFGPVKTRTG